MTRERTGPPMDPDTDEASPAQLDAARAGRGIRARPGAHDPRGVRDAGDGRFVPGLNVVGTLVAPDGEEVGRHEHPMLWHPMLYHYGRNWTVPSDGEYTLRVHVEPPRFPRHDDVNGRRFAEPVDVEFTGVRIERGRD